MGRRITLSRISCFRLVVALAFLLLIGRLAQLQLVQGHQYRLAAEQNRIRLLRRLGARGRIADRDGRLLAANRSRLTICLIPAQVSPGDRLRVLRLLAGLTGQPEAEIEQAVANAASRYQPVEVLPEADLAAVSAVQEHLPYLPGVTVETRLARCYPAGVAAHALGYLSQVAKPELLDSSYRPGDLIGRAGLERQAESHLRGGEGGDQVEVDSAGRPIRLLVSQPPASGHDLTLTLDARLQQVAERALQGRRGGLVALDPRTGEVLALASAPCYDPNLLAGPISPAAWARLNRPDRPQQNRAISGLYQPGSVFKIVTAAAALEAGQVSPESRFFCRGEISLGGWVFHCWLRRGHGPLDFMSGFAQSCNTVFMTLGQRVGATALAGMARRFGLGRPTGIDLPAEAAGHLPDPSGAGSHWYPGNTLQMAIGQSELLITPLQAARMAAAVANGGMLVTPHLIRGAQAPISSVGLRPETVAVIQQGLRAACERGTARGIFPSWLKAAGKTGTAENPHGAPHAWFAGYAPADSPRLAVAVVLEQGGHGAGAAAPIARQVFQAALQPR